MGHAGIESTLGGRKVESPVRNRKEIGDAAWKRGNTMWQNLN